MCETDGPAAQDARVDRAPAGLLSTRLDGLVESANRTLLDWLGRAPGDVIGRVRFPDMLPIAGRIYFETHLVPLLGVEHGFSEVALKLEGDGRTRDVLVTARRVDDAIHYVLFEAAQRRGYERELDTLRAAAETRSSWLRQVESLAGVGAWALDLDTGAMTWSDQLFALHDLPVASPPSLHEALQYFVEEDRPRVRQHIDLLRTTGDPLRFDAGLVTAKARQRRVRATAELERWGGRPKRIVGVVQDVTEQYEAEAQLWRSAHIDDLSGIANRKLFQKRFREMIAEVAADPAGGRELALIILDLDGFKEINDTLGHDAGDTVIRSVAGRLQELCARHDCARLGGDEFAVLSITRLGGADAVALAEAALESIRRDIPLEKEQIHVSGSAGIARFPSDADTPEGLMRCADIALYTSKRSGRAQATQYGREIGSMFDERRMAIELVRKALSDGTLVPAYQPYVSLDTGRVIGAEALARISDGTGALVGPTAFWSAMSDPDSIRAIDTRMLDLVTADMAAWQAGGRAPGTVSLNASGYSFENGDFAQDLLDRLDRLALPPSKLRIEVTETVLFGDNRRAVEKMLGELVAAGVSIALDDFGTGHASLIHLRDYPIDWIKIDRSFVQDLPSAERSKTIVTAMVDLAHALDIRVVAEGIETVDQLAFLRSVGCDIGQGHLFGVDRSACRAESALFDTYAMPGAAGDWSRRSTRQARQVRRASHA